MNSVTVGLIGIQVAQLGASLLIERRAVAFLPISQVIFLFVLIGSLLVEGEFNSKFQASTFLTAFSSTIFLGAAAVQTYLNSLPPYSSSEIAPPVRPLSSNAAFITLSAGLFISVGAAAIFFALKGVPLISHEPNTARTQSQEGAGMFYRIFLYGLPFLSAVTIGYAHATEQRRFRALFIAYLFLSTIILTLLGFKGYVLWYGLWLALFAALYSSSRRRTWIAFGAAMAVGLGAGGFVSARLIGGDFSEGLMFLLDRATRIASTGYVEIVHNYLPNRNPGDSVPADFPNYLALWMFGRESLIYQSDLEITLTAPGGLLLYLSPWPCLFIGILVGSMAQFANAYAARLRFTPILALLVLYPTFMALGWLVRGYVTNYFILPLSSLVLFAAAFIFADSLLRGSPVYKIYYVCRRDVGMTYNNSTL